MNFQELSWEEAACLTLQKSKKLFSSAEEILQYITSSNLKSNFNEVDRRSLEAILLCLSRGSSCKLVVSSRKLNGHSRETLRFALKEYVDSHMFHFVDVDLTDAELELVKLNGLLPPEHLPKENSKKSLCVIKAPYLSQYLEKKITKSRNNALQNGQLKQAQTKLSKTTNCVNESKNNSAPINNTNTKYFQLLQSPNSPLVTANLKCLVNETIFDELPSHIQDDLLNYLPDCDDSVSQLLNNEFFSSALETFRNHLADGLFTSFDFAETVIAPESEPPLKQLISESPNEDEHYNITAVSPTKIRIAKSYAHESINKTRSAKESSIAQIAADSEATSTVGKSLPAPTSTRRSGALSTAAPLLQNERVTALRKTTKSGRVIKTTNPALLESKPTYNTRSQRQNGYPSLKTKSSQQAILHSARSKTNDGKPKRLASGGKPSVRFAMPPPPSPWPKSSNYSTISAASATSRDHQPIAEQGTKTLASAKLVRKRKMHSYSLNLRWQPAVNVHSEWIHLSDDEPFSNDCFPIYPIVVERQPSKTRETSKDETPTEGASWEINACQSVNGETALPHDLEEQSPDVVGQENSSSDSIDSTSAHKSKNPISIDQTVLPSSLPPLKPAHAEISFDESNISQNVASENLNGLETQVSHSSISSDLVNTSLSTSGPSPSAEVQNGFGHCVSIATFMINNDVTAAPFAHSKEVNSSTSSPSADKSLSSQPFHLVSKTTSTSPSSKSLTSVSKQLVSSSFSSNPEIDCPSYQQLNYETSVDIQQVQINFENVLQESNHQSTVDHRDDGNESLAGDGGPAAYETVKSPISTNEEFSNEMICEHIESDKTKLSCPSSTVASSDNNNQLINSTDTPVAAYAFDNDKSSNFGNN